MYFSSVTLTPTLTLTVQVFSHQGLTLRISEAAVVTARVRLHGQGGPFLEAVGPQGALNAVLGTLQVEPLVGSVGVAHLQVLVDDMGHSGKGGPNVVLVQASPPSPHPIPRP